MGLERLEYRELLVADLDTLGDWSKHVADEVCLAENVPTAALADSNVLHQPIVSGEGEGGLTALDNYVTAADASYSFNILSTTAGPGVTIYDVGMTSQTWRSPAETTWTQWKHRMTILVPSVVTSSTSLMIVGGGGHNGTGGFGDSALTSSELFAAASLAISTGSVVAGVTNVPYQPLRFAGESTGRSEDAIIAKTYSQFLVGGDDNWPALLPMVKSVVRAMDTVQTVAQQEHSVSVDGFVISGASKRGWTTWLTAAADSRVRAIVPMVINVLNMDQQMAHHRQVYQGVTSAIVGGYSSAVQDYVNEGVFDHLTSARGQELLTIVDPYEYRDRLTMPKLMINATGDEFFVPDSDQFFISDLQGPTYLRYLPNRGHSLGPEAVTTLSQFYRAMIAGVSLPRFSWSAQPGAAIQVTTVDAPTTVKLWQATNPQHRDFRQGIANVNWTSTSLAPSALNSYIGQVSAPTSGHTAYFVELTYDFMGESMQLTTQVNVRSAQAANQPPVVKQPLGTINVQEDAPVVNIDLGQYFDDPDLISAADQLTYLLISNSGPGVVTPVINESLLSLTLLLDANGPAQVVVQARDLAGETVENTLTLQAAAINDPPEFDAGDDVQVAKNSGTYSQPWATNIAAAAGLLADPQRALDELSQTVEFVIFVNRPELFDVPPEVSSSGMLSFTPAVDAVGTAVVTVRSVDNGPSGSPHDNDSVPATLTITIQPTNNPPVALDDQFETDENSVLTVAGPGLLENDTDPDLPGDLLSVIPGVRQSSLKARVEVQEDGSFTYEPADVEVIDSLLVGETLQDTFTYVLRDQSNDQSDVATVVILVSGVNDPPVAVDDHMSVMTNFATTHDLLANDHDVDSQLDPASIVITRLPSAGTAEVTSEGLLRYTPAPGFVGTDSLSYTVRDAQGLLSNEAMVTLEIITSPWQNQSQNVDVNGNGRVTAMDALEIINYLNSGQPTRLSESNLIPPPHLDVNGDGRVTALDALLVINHLNNRGEGEAAQTQPTSLASPDDWLVLISQEVTKRRRGWL